MGIEILSLLLVAVLFGVLALGLWVGFGLIAVGLVAMVAGAVAPRQYLWLRVVRSRVGIICRNHSDRWANVGARSHETRL